MKPAAVPDGIGIAGVRLVGRDGHVIRDRARDEPGDLRRATTVVLTPMRCCIATLARRFAASASGTRCRKPVRTKPGSPAPTRSRPLGEVRERGPGQPRLALEVVVHAHEARRATGRGGADRRPLEHDDARRRGEPGGRRGWRPGPRRPRRSRRLSRTSAHSGPVRRWTGRATVAAVGAGGRYLEHVATTTAGVTAAAHRPSGPVAAALHPRPLVAALMLGCASRGPVHCPRRQRRRRSDRSARRSPRTGCARDLAMLAGVTDPANGYRSRRLTGLRRRRRAWSPMSLRASGWSVSEDAFIAPTFVDDGGSRLEAGGQTFGADDVRPLIFAPAGARERSGRRHRLGAGRVRPRREGLRGRRLRRPPGGRDRPRPVRTVLSTRPGAGRPGGGSRRLRGRLRLGAPSGSVPRPTLVDPGGLGRSRPSAPRGLSAMRWRRSSDSGGIARITTTGRTTEAPTRSIIAELAGSEPAR